MMIPRAKESLLAEYIFLSRVYRGIKRGLPTLYPSMMREFEWGIHLENPKSPIFHLPYFRNIFAGFRSLWTMLLEAKYLQPSAIWWTMLPH